MNERRFRIDSIGWFLGRGYSGRWAVALGVVALLVVWIGLYGAFRGWRSRYRALAEFGRTSVAPTVDPLADRVPPGVDAGQWRGVVARTHAMLAFVTAAGLLDRPRMEALRDELSRRVAAATPETAIAVLRAIWDDMERRAGPVLLRDPERPPQPPRRPGLLKRESPSPG